MRVAVFAFATALLIAGAWLWQSSTDAQESKRSAVVAQDEKIPAETAEQPMSFWMSKKLDYSKSMLEQLTKGDFDSLEREARKLRSLGKMEGFIRRRNADYVTQLQTFDMAISELIRHSNKGSAEGAVLAFNHMTTSCVACHQLLRQGVE
jgi:hypothetical protein